MPATFLHDDKVIPPDEQVDGRAPACPVCGQTLWLVNWTRRASDDGDRDVRSYECKSCGHTAEIVTEAPLAGIP
jgi:predicted RNA-binding Zn-ribbon protein involved in translation (DUF1610 family)